MEAISTNKINILCIENIIAYLITATPDFSGTWARDSANSDAVPSQMWMTRNNAAARGAAGGGRGAAAPGTAAPGTVLGAAPAAGRGAGGGRGGPQVSLLTIHQDAKVLHVVDPQNAIHEYAIEDDGSPHTEPMSTGIQTAKITAKLQADSLVIESSEPFGGMPGNVEMKIKEVWSLSPDGNTLTITTTRDIPARHEEYKEVYTRTQDQRGSICSDGCIVPK